jgi:hypothetical protein
VSLFGGSEMFHLTYPTTEEEVDVMPLPLASVVGHEARPADDIGADVVRSSNAPMQLSRKFTKIVPPSTHHLYPIDNSKNSISYIKLTWTWTLSNFP